LPGFDVELWQLERGFRAGTDALVLASDLPDLPEQPTIADLGTAHGSVILCVASTHPNATFYAVERQPELLALLRRNIVHNALDDRVTVVAGDLRDRSLLTPHSCDLVVANPPYVPANAGQMSSDPIRRQAHSEQHGTLADFVSAAQYLAKPSGLFRAIFPPKRLLDALDAIANTDFGVLSLQFFHGTTEHDAYLVRLTAKRGARGEMTVLPPRFVRTTIFARISRSKHP
jgi:tRNA1Val (adenine37-N6)-methyltransferase